MSLPSPEAVGMTGISRINFSPRARVPKTLSFEVPLPGTAAFSRVRGREGDLIVVQLVSSVGEKQERRDALRTLALKGPRSAALRRSSDPGTWGNIAKVRDMVAVIELPSVVYVSGHNPESLDDEVTLSSIEHYKYGSDTRPSELWRNADGEFFGYEAERAALLGYWSTAKPLDVILSECAELSLIPEASAEANVAIAKGADVQYVDGRWKDISEIATTSDVVSIVVPFSRGAELTWQAPYRRFHDMNAEHAEVGIMTSQPDPNLVRSLAHLTGHAALVDSGACRVSYRSKGALREFPV